MQQIKQSIVKCLHDTDGGDKKYKRKRKKGERCRVHYVWRGLVVVWNKTKMRKKWKSKHKPN